MSFDPPGFALIVDPTGARRSQFGDWAYTVGGSLLFEKEDCVAYGFGVSKLGPAGWSDNGTAGVLLGELRTADETAAGGGWYQGNAEPLALMFTQYGAAGLRSVEGLFCCATWNQASQRLTLFRDPSSARAIYWYKGEGWLAVATRLDLLVRQPGIRRNIGRRGLVEYLRFLDVSPPNTIYDGVVAIEPGVPTILSVDGGTFAEEELAVQKETEQSTTNQGAFENAVDALDEALQQSIAARLMPDMLTGISLSGGVDSSLLCAIGAGLDPDRVAAFTLGFDERAFDESPTATSVAEHLRMTHHRFSYTLDDYFARFPEFAGRIDLPFADPAGLPTLMFFEDVQQTTNLLLDGTGADTLVGVIPARHTRIATQYVSRLPRAVRRLVGGILGRLPIASEYSALWDFDSPEDLLIRWKGWTRDEIAILCNTEVDLHDTRFFRLYRDFSRHDHFERYSALLGNLPDDRVHQAAELTGLAVRFPYWDHQVEAVIQTLPRNFRSTEDEPKRLLRALLSRYVPRELWEQPKHGFDFPFLALMRHNDNALIDRYLAPAIVKEFAIVDAKTVATYVDRFVGGDDGLAFRVWGLVVLFAWLEHHFAAR